MISEHGVPEFLTVKGKTWHTYAEGVFARWTRRMTGTSHEDLVSSIVAAAPLVIVIVVALVVALRLRAHSELRTDFRPLPTRRLGAWRWPALALPIAYLSCGVGVPVVVMLRWAAGLDAVAAADVDGADAQELPRRARADRRRPRLHGAARRVDDRAGCRGLAVPLARLARERFRFVEGLSILPLAVPAVLLGIGFVHVFNSRPAGAADHALGFDFYDSMGVVACAYAARFLPFGVLTLASALRRQPKAIEEAIRSGSQRSGRDAGHPSAAAAAGDLVGFVPHVRARPA